MADITVVAHNIRSAHNVGAIFRTSEGFGVKHIVLSGYTPYPELSLNHTAPMCAYIDSVQVTLDPRLPHIRERITRDIHKTALGAEALVPFTYYDDISAWLDTNTLPLVALEQAPDSVPLSRFQPPEAFALLLGEEVDGIVSELLERCDYTVEIPMEGKKESFNVSVATGIALYALTSGN